MTTKLTKEQQEVVDYIAALDMEDTASTELVLIDSVAGS